MSRARSTAAATAIPVRSDALEAIFVFLSNDRVCVDRFGREASLPGSVDGPGVAQIIEVRQQCDLRYFAGVPAREPPEDHRELGPGQGKGGRRSSVRIANRLAEFHSLGIVRRDITPPNIVVGSEGVPKTRIPLRRTNI
jgi:serine/threonine protein kinase